MANPYHVVSSHRESTLTSSLHARASAGTSTRLSSVLDPNSSQPLFSFQLARYVRRIKYTPLWPNISNLSGAPGCAHCYIQTIRILYLKRTNAHDLQDKEDEVVDLPEDDPEVVERMLNYIYTNEYNLVRGSCKKHFCEGPHISFQWEQYGDGANRAERLKVHNALKRMSYRVLKNFLDTWFSHSVLHNQRSDCIFLDSRYIVGSHSRPTKVKAFHDAAINPSNDANDLLLYDNRNIGLSLFNTTNAEMYLMADKYDIPGLRDLAYDKLDSSIGVPVQPSLVQFLMENTPDTDKKIRHLLGEKIHMDMDLFGVRDEIQEILDYYPELGKYAFDVAFS